MSKKKTLWDVWQWDLPVVFPKEQVIAKMGDFWGIKGSVNVRNRLKSGRFEVVKDLSAIYRICFIGFDLESGFYFDRAGFEASVDQEEEEFAESLGLS